MNASDARYTKTLPCGPIPWRTRRGYAPPAAVGKNHHQADIDLASKKAQGLTGASASALGTTETEAGKRM